MMLPRPGVVAGVAAGAVAAAVLATSLLGLFAARTAAHLDPAQALRPAA